MAIRKEEESREEQSTSFLLDALYCEEDNWEDEEEEEVEAVEENSSFTSSTSSFVLLQQDLFWEDEDLVTLLSKEERLSCLDDVYLSTDRKEAVGWILKVNAHYGFSTLAAVLAITYLDKFICSYNLQRDKPWMLQLVSVACLSLAAKVEETHVPLLLDFQVEETKYLFEAKTIQRMELLILSTLQWKMHLITPISFLDHIIRRLGLINNTHWDFLNRCHRLLLSVISDSRFVGYLPSVVAAATMMRIIDQVEPLDPLCHQTNLLGVLNITKEKVEACYDLILHLSLDCIGLQIETQSSRKRKNRDSSSSLSSPSCVIDSNPFNSDESSNDSWSASSFNPPSSSSPQKEPPLKKMRGAQETKEEPLHLPLAIVATP